MNYYRDLLDSKNQRLYDTLLNVWKRKEKVCHIEYSSNTNIDYLNSIVQYILLDHPEIFYIVVNTIRIFVTQATVCIHADFIYGLDTIIKVEKKLAALQNHIVKKCFGHTSIEKYKLIHEIILKKTKYVEGTIVETKHHSIIGPLLDHMAVCDGFAKILKVLCDCVDIPCIVVRGKAVSQYSPTPAGHAWNILLFDKQWVHCDITWDSLSPWQDIPSYAYSFLPDHIIGADHSWNNGLVPQCAPIPIGLMQTMLPCIRSDKLQDMFSYIISGKSGICIRVIRDKKTSDVNSLIKQFVAINQTRIRQYIFIEPTSTLLIHTKERA